MSSDVPSIDAIREEAVRWRLRLEGEVGDAAREDFHRWIAADPRHEQEFLAVSSIAFAMSDFSRETGAALLAPPAAIAAPAVAGTRGPRWARGPWSAAIAASLLVAVAVGGWAALRPSGILSESFATETGEVRTVRFEDGSVAYLNTRTHLEWQPSFGDRRVRLFEGEALFDVVHDEARPFRVVLDHSEIQVRGTRFNVYRKKSGDVVVTVLEGTVDVEEMGHDASKPAWKRELHAGQRIVYRPIGLISDVHDTQALDAVKWREGVLQVANEPLQNVLDELTRYTDQRIVIRDPRIAEMPIGGALSTRDVRGALRSIQALKPDIIVREEGGQFTLSHRPQAE